MQVPNDAGLQPIERGHQCLGYVAAAERTKSPLRIGQVPRHRIGAQQGTHDSFSRRAAAARTARTNSWIFAGSLTPGSDSTPLLTSTPKGRTAWMASATFCADKPPARITSV